MPPATVPPPAVGCFIWRARVRRKNWLAVMGAPLRVLCTRRLRELCLRALRLRAILNQKTTCGPGVRMARCIDRTALLLTPANGNPLLGSMAKRPMPFTRGTSGVKADTRTVPRRGLATTGTPLGAVSSMNAALPWNSVDTNGACGPGPVPLSTGAGPCGGGLLGDASTIGASSTVRSGLVGSTRRSVSAFLRRIRCMCLLAAARPDEPDIANSFTLPANAASA